VLQGGLFLFDNNFFNQKSKKVRRMKRSIIYIILFLLLASFVSAEKLSSTVIMAKTVSDSKNILSSMDEGKSSSGSHSSFIRCGDDVCAVNEYCEKNICKAIDSPTTVLPVQTLTPNEDTGQEGVLCPSPLTCEVCEPYEQCKKDNNNIFYFLLFISALITIYAIYKCNEWYKEYNKVQEELDLMRTSK
jgi:hypothetical protein